MALVEVGAVASRYPVDVSVYGVRGLAGNVADWTSTEVSGVQGSARVLRGGAFYLPAGFLRSAFRGGIDPTFRDVYIGFRVAWQPPGGA